MLLAQMSRLQQASNTPNTTVTSTSDNWNKFIIKVEKIGKDSETISSSFSKIFTLGAWIFVFIILIIIVIKRLNSLASRTSSQLIIENFVNASGDGSLDKKLVGISQLAREKLAREIKNVRRRVRNHPKSLGLNGYHPSEISPLPRETSDESLTKLLISLNEVMPSPFNNIGKLFPFLFPVCGTKVRAFLQYKRNKLGKVGISFEVKDMAGKQEPLLYTVWETSNKKDTNNFTNEQLLERYTMLLRPAIRWLAVELSRREMVSNVPLIYSGYKKKQYQSQINNFFSALNNACGRTHGDFFYRLAIEDAQKAIELDLNWYQPYENVAEAYSYLKQQYQAIDYYSQALNKTKDKTTQLILKVGRAKAKLLTGDSDLFQEAKQEIEQVERQCNNLRQENARLLYNLAVWYALACKNEMNTDYYQKARLYLAYSLVKETQYWDWAAKDDELDSILDGFNKLTAQRRKLIKIFHDESNENSIIYFLKNLNWL